MQLKADTTGVGVELSMTDAADFGVQYSIPSLPRLVGLQGWRPLLLWNIFRLSFIGKYLPNPEEQ